MIRNTSTEIVFDQLDSENSIIFEANVEEEYPKLDEVIHEVIESAQKPESTTGVALHTMGKRRRTAMERKIKNGIK